MTNYANRPSQASQRYVKNRAGLSVPNHAFRGRTAPLQTARKALRPRLTPTSVPEISYRHGSPNIGLPPGEYSFGPISGADQNVDDGFHVAVQDSAGVTAGVIPPRRSPYDSGPPIGISPRSKGGAGDSFNLPEGGRIAVNGYIVTVYDHDDDIMIETDVSL